MVNKRCFKLTPFYFSLQVVGAAKEYSNYAKSPFVDKIKEEYEFELVKDPVAWKYVEKLMPYEGIPKVLPKDQYPSGWIPPKEEAKTLNYFIPRMKDHSLPIYLQLAFRGQRKTTLIKRVEGDIWLLNDLIKSHLKNKHQKYVETRVNELAQFIEIKGDYVNDVLEWAYAKGF